MLSFSCCALFSFQFCLFVWFDSLHPSPQIFSYVGTGLPGLNQYQAGLMCLAHNAVMQVRLEPATCRSQVKHSTTEPLRSLPFQLKHFYLQLLFSLIDTGKLWRPNQYATECHQGLNCCSVNKFYWKNSYCSTTIQSLYNTMIWI